MRQHRKGFGAVGMIGMRLGAVAALPFLLWAIAAGAQAKEDGLTLRIKAAGNQIQFFHRGKKLTDSRLNQLCAAAKARKTEIAFQRDRMTGDNALAAILKEAQCLGATHSGLTKIGQEAAPKSAAHRHAKPRHKAGARR
jgi:hypothetical protein